MSKQLVSIPHSMSRQSLFYKWWFHSSASQTLIGNLPRCLPPFSCFCRVNAQSLHSIRFRCLADGTGKKWELQLWNTAMCVNDLLPLSKFFGGWRCRFSERRSANSSSGQLLGWKCNSLFFCRAANNSHLCLDGWKPRDAINFAEILPPSRYGFTSLGLILEEGGKTPQLDEIERIPLQVERTADLSQTIPVCCGYSCLWVIWTIEAGSQPAISQHFFFLRLWLVSARRKSPTWCHSHATNKVESTVYAHLYANLGT